MHGRKLSVLLLIPMVMILVVPLSTHAVGNTYYLVVACYNDFGPKAADSFITFLGHHIQVACHGVDHYGKPGTLSTISFVSSQPGTYNALGIAGDTVQASSGSFSPSDSYTYGYTYDSYGVSGAFWSISTVGYLYPE